MSKKPRNKGGRPTVMTPDVLQKLEDSFTNAFTDEMACLYAGVSTTTLYDYCVEHPKFAERKEVLKRTPDLAAQKKLVEDAAGSVSGARWWAEHKMSDFIPKSKIDHGVIKTQDVTQTEGMKEIAREYEDRLKKEIIASRKTKTP